MGLFRRLFGGRARGHEDLKPHRLDYLNEALALERQGDYDAALTSYRLALRDRPNDPRILQDMAIVLSKIGRLDDAIRHYRQALEADQTLPGAHYGLGFLLLRRGDAGAATDHLKRFLEHPPRGADADKWITRAREALKELGIETIEEAPARLEGA